MMNKIMLGMTIALFAAGISFSASAHPPPDAPCNASNEGAQTSTQHESGYIVWECRSGYWMFMLQYECDERGMNCIPM